MKLFSRACPDYPHMPHMVGSLLSALILFVVFLTGDDERAGYKVALLLSVFFTVVGGCYGYKDFRANEREGPVIPIQPLEAEELLSVAASQHHRGGYEILA